MSTNPSRDAMDDAKPGTSSSFLQGSPDMVTPFSENTSPESSPASSSLKVKNASRDRPPGDTPETKRQRVSQDDSGVARDHDQVAMETDSSSSGHHSDDQNEDSDQENPNLLQIPQIFTPESGSRRSSYDDEGVSTTIPVTSHQPEDQVDTMSPPNIQPGPSHFESSPSLADLFPPSSFRRSVSQQPSRRINYRDTTPVPGSGEDTSNFYFQRGSPAMDVNENQGPEQFLQKLHGKQRLMWARKLFFLSTELIFPGFEACNDKQNNMPELMGVKVRSSVTMQALLYADSLFFLMWVLSFLTTCDIILSVLKQLHGYLYMCLTILFILVNILRLRFGLKGNENDEVQYLALFWMTTVIVQIPLFAFIFLTDLFSPVLLAFTVTMDATMICFIILETIIGFVHFRSLLRDEMNVIRMARRSKDSVQSRNNIRNQSHDLSQGSLGVSHLAGSSRLPAPQVDESSSDTEDSERPSRMNFQMQIRRLSESQRHPTPQATNQADDDSDSSGQVTSTSDTVRQRSIRAH